MTRETRFENGPVLQRGQTSEDCILPQRPWAPTEHSVSFRLSGRKTYLRLPTNPICPVCSAAWSLPAPTPPPAFPLSSRSFRFQLSRLVISLAGELYCMLATRKTADWVDQEKHADERQDDETGRWNCSSTIRPVVHSVVSIGSAYQLLPANPRSRRSVAMVCASMCSCPEAKPGQPHRWRTHSLDANRIRGVWVRTGS